MSQYAVCSEDLNEIQQHLNDDNEDQFDSIAPVTQNIELQDENEGNQDLHPDFNETDMTYQMILVFHQQHKIMTNLQRYNH